MKKIVCWWLVCLPLLFSQCSKEDDPVDPSSYQEAGSMVIHKDLARYNPGQSISFVADQLPENAKVRYLHVGETLRTEELEGGSWTWTPPLDDFQGYLVEVCQIQDGKEVILGTVGVDVSSDWTRFPRYGFLSEFGDLSASELDAVLDRLKDYHINGLQFYDWHHKHHTPLKMNGNTPAFSWVDISGRTIRRETVQAYIEKARERQMASMFYNLMFGLWADYAADGASEEWLLFNDPNHQQVNQHDLPDSWESDLLLADPGNPEWQDYIFQKTSQVYEHLDFDGWHLDQLGDRGTVYDYNGNPVSLPSAYQDFLEKLDQSFPEKKMVMNAVNQFGQSEILNTPVDFAYTEVWHPNEGFDDLANLILQNEQLSGGALNTILAAYINYDLADASGTFNTPGVLLADAVIFAFGGAHLELGEHMLAKEYFPNDHLEMTDELRYSLRNYYDFLVAYQNLLRDGGLFNQPLVTSVDGKVNFSNWPPDLSSVTVVGKEWPDRQVVHLINFSNANSLDWRDSNGTQSKPVLKENLKIHIQNDQPVSRVWLASPDVNGGSPIEIHFSKDPNGLVCEIPSLLYWDMIVIEYP